ISMVPAIYLILTHNSQFESSSSSVYDLPESSIRQIVERYVERAESAPTAAESDAAIKDAQVIVSKFPKDQYLAGLIWHARARQGIFKTQGPGPTREYVDSWKSVINDLAQSIRCFEQARKDEADHRKQAMIANREVGAYYEILEAARQNGLTGITADTAS